MFLSSAGLSAQSGEPNYLLPMLSVGLAAAAGIAVYAYTTNQVGSRMQGVGKKTEHDAKPTGPTVDVFFGSQTGTAEEFAKALSKEGVKRGFNMKAVDIERHDPDALPGSTAIFLVATYGEGDPTDNSKAFHSWLTGEASEGDLQGMHFAVFGLGNTQYEHYNTMGKTVDR